MINGHISKEYTAVWIEDDQGRMISDIIESIGKDKIAAAKTKQALLAAHRITAQPTLTEVFERINSGVSYKFLHSIFGQYEKDITREIRPISRPMFYKTMKTLRFKNVGSFKFSCFTNDDCIVTAKLPIISSGDLSSPQQIKKRLDEAEPTALRLILKDYDQYDLSSPATIDVFAQKLWEIRAQTSSAIVNAAEHLCLIIGDSGYYRYRGLLQQLITADIDNDIIKAARKAKARLYRGDTTPIKHKQK
jgi:hypothetical protein